MISRYLFCRISHTSPRCIHPSTLFFLQLHKLDKTVLAVIINSTMTIRTYEFSEPTAATLPARPVSLRHFEGSHETYEDAITENLKSRVAVALGGLSLFGHEGYMVGTLGIVSLGNETSEGLHVKGWSLHLGHPEEKYRQLRHFDTERDEPEDILLPLPNAMIYFAGQVDTALAEVDARPQELIEVANFIALFLSDDGAPRDIDW